MSDIVQADPGGLAAQAGVGIDQYALARMIASEIGSGTFAEQVACAECARNKAAERGVSVSQLLLRANPRSAQSDGLFSRHIVKEDGSTKWASTFQSPSKENSLAAVAVMNGSNSTGGAVDFYAPGEVKRSTAIGYFKSNARAGLQWTGPLDGVDARKMMTFVRVGEGADVSGALAFLDGSGDTPPEDTVGPMDDVQNSKSVLAVLIDAVAAVFRGTPDSGV